MRTFLALCAAVAVAAPVLAAPALAQTAPTKDPAQVQAGSYVVDTGHTQVVFSVSHMGLSPYFMSLSDVTGTLELNPKDLAASSVKVKMPVKSIGTTSAKLTEELKGAQWLNAEKNPEITFVSTKITPDSSDKDEAKISGDLTINGITKPVTLEAKLYGAGANPMNKKVTVGFTAEGKIKRSDFGVKTYIPVIGDDLDIKITAAFERKD